jgi:hypothetical protein
MRDFYGCDKENTNAIYGTISSAQKMWMEAGMGIAVALFYNSIIIQ